MSNEIEQKDMMKTSPSESTATVNATPQTQQPRFRIMTSFQCKLTLSLFIVGVLGTFLAITMEVILPKEGQWTGLESHHCNEFCENFDSCDHSMDERPTVQQPVNAYTNLAYMWCGIVPLLFFRVDLSTVMYFCSSMLLGVSSFMYHASISRLWLNMDSATMYTYICSLVMHGLFAVFGIPWRCLAPPLLTMIIAMPFIRPRIPVSIGSAQINFAQVCLVALLCLALVVAQIYKIINHAYARRRFEGTPCFESIFDIIFQSLKIVGVALVPAIFCGIATVGWINDRGKRWCDPDSRFQWHGVWVSGKTLWKFSPHNHGPHTLLAPISS